LVATSLVVFLENYKKILKKVNLLVNIKIQKKKTKKNIETKKKKKNLD